MAVDLSGQTLDHYQIERLLGQGGMGAVYQAMDTRLERQVALKIMHANLAAQPEFQSRFLTEARASARLDHPNIVRVLSFDLIGGQLFLVMELVRGGSLRHYMKRLYAEKKYLQLAETLELMRQLTNALHYAHQQGMVHRDIKPDNVLLKRGNDDTITAGNPNAFQVVLTDFGLAKLVETSAYSITGQPMGTLPYMSPEQCLGETVDVRTDIYALGVMLYELAVGQLPYQPKSLTEAIRMHTRDPLPSALTVRPGLPAALDRVIEKCLAKNADDRYQTAGELARELQGLQRSISSEELTLIEGQPQTTDSLTTYLMSRPNEAPMPAFTPSPPLPHQAGRDRLSIAAEGKAQRTLSIEKDFMLIGREPGIDIELNSNNVSRQHARIERSYDGQYRVTDLGSRNGTYIGQTRLPANVPAPWNGVDPLKIGEFWLRLEAGRKREDSTQPIRIHNSMPAQQMTQAYSMPNPSAYDSSMGTVGMTMPSDAVRVAPGGTASTTVEIVNQSQFVDHFVPRLTGLPQEWYTLSTTPLQLMPNERVTLNVQFHPPPMSNSAAGTYPFQVQLESQTQRGATTVVRSTLHIGAYYNHQVDMQPKRVRLGTAPILSISNGGNAPTEYYLSGADREGVIQFGFAPERVLVNPGQTAQVPVRMLSPGRALFGGANVMPFNVQVRPLDGSDRVFDQQGELVKSARFPAWMPALLLPLCGLIGVLALVFSQDQTRRANEAATAAAGTAIALNAGADTDGDGLTNGDEVRLGTDLNSPDTDNDGLTDAVEANEQETNPLQRDTDRDGLPDGQEVNEAGTDPQERDSDGDGLTDGQEVNTERTNPLDRDSDDDGISDGADTSPISTSTPPPPTVDLVGTQGAINAQNAATQTAFANLVAATQTALGNQVVATQTAIAQAATLYAITDTDGDGLTNQAEGTNGTDPNNPDTDGDGFLDGFDPAPLLPPTATFTPVPGDPPVFDPGILNPGVLDSGIFIVTPMIFNADLVLANPGILAFALLRPASDPSYGTFDLNNGFVPDPFTLSVTSGGSLDVSALGITGVAPYETCQGFAPSAPHVRLNWNTATNGRLRFSFTGDGDTTLIVHDPFDQWFCNDDADGTNPAISLESAASGEYTIWVGSYTQDAAVTGTLAISEFP